MRKFFDLLGSIIIVFLILALCFWLLLLPGYLHASEIKPERVVNIRGKIVFDDTGNKSTISIKNTSIQDFIRICCTEIFKRAFVLDRGIETLAKKVDVSILKNTRASDVWFIFLNCCEKFGIEVEDVGGALLFSVKPVEVPVQNDKKAVEPVKPGESNQQGVLKPGGLL